MLQLQLIIPVIHPQFFAIPREFLQLSTALVPPIAVQLLNN